MITIWKTASVNPYSSFEPKRLEMATLYSPTPTTSADGAISAGKGEIQT